MVYESVQLTGSPSGPAVVPGDRYAKLIWLWSISALVGSLFSTALAEAHDTWVSRKQFQDPASGAWCCDEHDCSPLDNRDPMAAGSFIGVPTAKGRRDGPSFLGQFSATGCDRAQGPSGSQIRDLRNPARSAPKGPDRPPLNQSLHRRFPSSSTLQSDAHGERPYLSLRPLSKQKAPPGAGGGGASGARPSPSPPS
jgi:hypothetical protein